MKLIGRIFGLVFAVSAFALISGSLAQEQVPPTDTMGDLTLRSRREDLDSYWLDTNQWAFYGYRPHLQGTGTRFDPSLPSYFSGQNAYSYGVNLPDPAASLSGGLNKNAIQYTGGGTWH